MQSADITQKSPKGWLRNTNILNRTWNEVCYKVLVTPLPSGKIVTQHASHSISALDELLDLKDFTKNGGLANT